VKVSRSLGRRRRSCPSRRRAGVRPSARGRQVGEACDGLRGVVGRDADAAPFVRPRWRRPGR
jgi:hypothetical protein